MEWAKAMETSKGEHASFNDFHFKSNRVLYHILKTGESTTQIAALINLSQNRMLRVFNVHLQLFSALRQDYT